MSSLISLLALGLLAVSSSTVALGPAPVRFGTAANYTILAQTGVSTVPPSAISGAIGVSPAAGTLLTGFDLTLAPGGTFSTSTQVVGELFAGSYASPTPSILTTAISDSQAAYGDASGRANPDFSNLNTGEIGGLSLSPGLYKWTTGVTTGSDVTITGTASDTWIFQISGNFNVAGGKSVNLVGGALAKNIVWVVAGSATFGPGAHVEGLLLVKGAITLETGTTVNGRVIGETSIALQKATVVPPA